MNCAPGNSARIAVWRRLDVVGPRPGDEQGGAGVTRALGSAPALKRGQRRRDFGETDSPGGLSAEPQILQQERAHAGIRHG